MLESSAAIRRVVDAAQRDLEAKATADIASVRRIATAARPWLDGQRISARASLQRRVDQHRRAGAPPPLFRLMGLSNREVPFNRLLGWTLDPRTPMGRCALTAICEVMSPALAQELDAGLTPEVRAESTWPTAVRLTTQPDLLIIGESAILLIENKVWSGESGAGQYAGYLLGLRRLAGIRGNLDYSVYLLARDGRETPEDWSGFFTHREFAGLLRQALPRVDGVWDRIALTLTARSLEQAPPVETLLHQAEQLLGLEEPSTEAIARMMKLEDSLRHCEQPWRGNGENDVD